MNTCTHTAGVGDSPPNWTVTFRENHAVNRIVLYNRFDSADVPCCPERLMHFGLQTFNANYSPVFSYRDAGDTALLTYTVTVPDAQRHVLINGIRVDSNIQVLTLCEVQAFGECAPGTWGLECKNKCNPSCGTSCDVENGLCQSCIGFSSPPTCDIECESNQWGINCHQNCSTQCYVQSCNSRTGVCDKGCNGYNDPPFCTVPCPRTTWGLNCMGSCSNCIEMSCDKQSGKCDKGCDGYSNPPICNTECTSGLWGRDCRYSCSSHCSNTSCDRHSGICDEGCNGYDNFPDCNQKCLPGKWGANCTNRCNNCVNRSCDHVSGKCSAACEVGYINFPDCSPAPSQVQENPLLNTVIGLGIALGVACAFSIVLLVLMFARKRKGTLIETKRDPPNYDTATSGKEYFRQYETAVTKDPYQNACTSYEKTREQRTLEKSNAQPYKVYEEDTNAMNEYESIGLNKF
ncbi:unnamed protein product [Lymnaea stagnalis]|uniref:Uncharacterized protein n=1 Tax=Lymnaea stagnalis TaxID=6523 RepID=A0AAV2HJH4_LYMST